MKVFFILGALLFVLVPFNQVSAHHDSTSVSIESSGFNPNSLTIHQGSTITWTNNETFVITITSGTPSAGPDGEFDSGILTSGSTFSYTFNNDGDFFYFDMLHPWISGAVTVSTSSPPPIPPSPPGGPVACESDGKLPSGGKIIVEVISSAPNAGDSLELNLQFKDTSSGSYVTGINYGVTVSQLGATVLSDTSNSISGITNLSTSPLLSNDPVDIDLTIGGVGPITNDDIWVSPLDESFSYTMQLPLPASSCTTTTSDDLKNDILNDIDNISGSVASSDPKDNLMSEANELVDLLAKIDAIKNPATKDSLHDMTENVIVSYFLASTPGGLHDDSKIQSGSVTCDRHYIKAVYSSIREFNVVLSSSTNVGRSSVTTNPVSIDGTCIPYVIKGGYMLSSQFTVDEKTLVFDIHSLNGGDFWVSFSNSLLDINKHEGDKLTIKLNDVLTDKAQILTTDTISVLKIPFHSSTNQIDISVQQDKGDCIRFSPWTFVYLGGQKQVDYCFYLETVYKTIEIVQPSIGAPHTPTNNFPFIRIPISASLQ